LSFLIRFKGFELKGVLIQLLTWVVFTSTSPFIFYKLIPFHPYKTAVFLGLVLIFISFFWLGLIKGYEKNILIILLLQFFFSTVFFLLHFFYLGVDFKYINLSFQFITNLVLYLFISSFFDVYKLIKTNVVFISLMSFLGFITFMLLVLGLWRSFGSFMGPSWETQNYLLTTAGAVWLVEDFSVIRVGGFFDEPGTFAFYITFALITNRLLNYNRFLEFVLIFTGLFTFSVAFFITVLFYYLINYSTWKNFKYLLSLSCFLFFSLFLIDKFKSESRTVEVISIISVNRFLSSEDDSKVIDGDTRSEPTLLAFAAFLDSPFFGHGLSISEQPLSKYFNKFIGANAFTPFAYHGIFGVVIFYGLWIYWSIICLKTLIRNPSRTLFSSWFIVFINLLQRPDAFIGTYGYFVFIFLIYSTKKYNEKFNEKLS
jgi:hypothetical protein